MNQKNIEITISLLIYLNLQPDCPEGTRARAALAEPAHKPPPSPFCPHGKVFSSHGTMFIAGIEGIITGHVGTRFLKQLLEGEEQVPWPGESKI